MRKIFILLGIILTSTVYSQTTTRVQDLDPADAPDGNDIMYFEQDGVAKNITRELLLDGVSDTLAILYDSIGVSTDTAQILRSNLNAKIALDEPERIIYTSKEVGIDDTDTVVVKSNNVVTKITKGEFQYDLVQDITSAEGTISELEDSITALRTTIALLELSSEFDSLRLSTNADSIYAYWTSPTGQVIIPWKVGEPQDRTPPTYVSGEIGTYSDSVIVLTMSEHILGDSILEYSGGAGGIFTGMDAAYNFDQTSGPTGLLLDQIASDDATNSGAYNTDSVGVGDKAWYFDGTDNVVIATGQNVANNDFSFSVWVKPHSLAADFRILSGASDGLFVYYNASDNGIGIGKTGADVSTTATDTDLTVNVWNHVCGSYDEGTNTLTVFINTTSETESYTPTGGLFAGVTKYIGAASASSYFTGLMDDLFIWNGELLTQNRVDSLYNSGAGRRYNGSGGSQLSNTDTITAAFISNITPLQSGWAVDSVWSVANKIYLDLTSEATYGDNVKFRYTRPTGAGAARGARDTADNYLATIADFQTVVNNIYSSASFTVYWEEDFEGAAQDTVWNATDFDNVFGNHETWKFNWVSKTGVTESTINGASTNVMFIKHTPTEVYNGFEAVVDKNVTDQVYLSYNWKFSPTFNSTRGGKLPGFHNVVADVDCPMTITDGWLVRPHFKQWQTFNPYRYDFSTGSCPDDGGGSTSFTFHPGNWYNVTQRLVYNTFTGSTANYDGIYEVWVDGVMIYQESGLRIHIDSDPAMAEIGLNLSHFYGGDNNDTWWPTTNCHALIDNISFYKPNNDATWDATGADRLHDPADILVTPDVITSKDFYTTSTITSAAADLESANYSSNSDNHTNEMILITAGVGERVRVEATNGTQGGGEGLFFLDGNTTEADLIGVKLNYDGDYTDTDFGQGTNGKIESSGRHLMVKWITDISGFGYFNFDVTFF